MPRRCRLVGSNRIRGGAGLGRNIPKHFNPVASREPCDAQHVIYISIHHSQPNGLQSFGSGMSRRLRCRFLGLCTSGKSGTSFA